MLFGAVVVQITTPTHSSLVWDVSYKKKGLLYYNDNNNNNDDAHARQAQSYRTKAVAWFLQDWGGLTSTTTTESGEGT
eukprot:2187485-Amphidinium_carterae.2